MPHNEHLWLATIVLYKAFFVFDSGANYWIVRLVAVAIHCGIVALLFVLSRRRVGSIGALMIAVLFLFLGSGYIEFMWPFQIAILVSLLGALLAMIGLDMGSRRGDRLTLVGLLLALNCTYGVPIVIGVAGEMLVRKIVKQKKWIVVIPTALYASWFATYGTSGDASVAHPLRSIAYAINMAVSACAGAVGLGQSGGRLVLAALAVALVVRFQGIDRKRQARAVMSVLFLLAFWGLAGISRSQLPGTYADPKYVYPSVLFLLILGIQLFSPPRAVSLPHAQQGVIVVIVLSVFCFALTRNIRDLRNGAQWMRDSSSVLAGELASLESARAEVKIDPFFVPDPVNAPQLRAGDYFDAIRHIRSPAFKPNSLNGASPEVKAAADRIRAEVLAPNHFLSTADQAELVSLDHVFESYCAAPAAHRKSEVHASVLRLIEMHQAHPNALARGPLFAGQSISQISAEVEGLLNLNGCDPQLAAELGAAAASG